VRLRDRRFYDAGVAESIPFRTPLAQGATHVLILRSRLGPTTATTAGGASVNGVAVDGVRPPRSIRLLARTSLRKESPELRAALFTRSARTAADIARIAELEADGRALSIRPSPTAPPVSRLTTDGRLLAAAFEEGRQAFLGTFEH
jgi:hypothetical protein